MDRHVDAKIRSSQFFHILKNELNKQKTDANISFNIHK